ncbi:MAG: response regulator [Phycisphaerales bacterium]|nr:response regulator [Phycisphaerales bacterium]
MAKHQQILVVEDERDLSEILVMNLEKEGYNTLVAYDGLRAVELAREEAPDLILLDLMLPNLSGTDVAKRIRTDPMTSSIPIIMLTAKAEEIDEVLGLAVGADDYITKPFSTRVLLARVDTVLRRCAQDEAASTLRLGPLEINEDVHQVLLDGEPVKLTLTEFRLLASLVKANGRVLSRSTLMSRAMGPGVTVTERTIDVHVTSIRRKLGEHASLVETIRGVGYRASSEPREQQVDVAH